MDSLGQRMKRYEAVTDMTLTPRMPCVIRVDGKSFHQWTRTVQAARPFDEALHTLMIRTMITLCEQFQGAVMGYTQSDEISVILQDYWDIATEPAFGKRVLKLVSIAASLATAIFNDAARHVYAESVPWALFDARAFVLPLDEVVNYLIWRQQDAVRNSIRMVGYTYFPHTELKNVSNAALQDRLWHERGINWNNYPIWAKRGSCAIRNPDTGQWIADHEPPTFTQNRPYIMQRIMPVLP